MENKFWQTKRFWGTVVAAIGGVLKTQNNPYADLVIAVGAAVLGSGIIDASKNTPVGTSTPVSPSNVSADELK